MRKTTLFISSLLLLSFSGCDDQISQDPAASVISKRTSEVTLPIGPEDHAAFGRLAKTFVGSQQHPSGTKTYYTEPKPYGSWLCRVDSVSLPEWIATGRSKQKSEFWKDDLKIEHQFAAWRSPRDESAGSRDDACKSFRRFDELFFADGIDGPARYIFLLDQLLGDLSDDQVPYGISCTDGRLHGSKANECDPKQILQDITIYSSFSGETLDSPEVEDGRLWKDSLQFYLGHEHGHPVILSISFDSKQTYGKQSNSEADILAAKIAIVVA